jgi:hypothetical protein
MSITHQVYIVRLPKDEALAALKLAAEAEHLQIVEESDAGFFCLERRTRRQWITKGPPSRLAVSLEVDRQGSIATVVGWDGSLNGVRTGHLVWGLFAEPPLVYSATPAGLAAVGPGGVPAWNPLRPPSWVRWTRFGAIAPLCLLIPVTALAIWMIVSLGAWYGLALAYFWCVVAVLAPSLVSEIVARAVRQVRSRRGVFTGISNSVVSVAVYFAISFLARAIVGWLD